MQFEVVVSGADLRRSIDEVTAEILRDIEKQAPEQFRQVLDNPPPSKEGGPPAKRLGKLIRTLHVVPISPTEAELVMEDYAKYLDPFFEEPNYDRPFIQRGIARTLEQI